MGFFHGRNDILDLVNALFRLQLHLCLPRTWLADNKRIFLERVELSETFRCAGPIRIIWHLSELAFFLSAYCSSGLLRMRDAVCWLQASLITLLHIIFNPWWSTISYRWTLLESVEIRFPDLVTIKRAASDGRLGSRRSDWWVARYQLRRRDTFVGLCGNGVLELSWVWRRKPEWM